AAPLPLRQGGEGGTGRRHARDAEDDEPRDGMGAAEGVRPQGGAPRSMTLDRDLDELRTKVSGCKALGLIDLPSGFMFSFGGPGDAMGLVQTAGSSVARLFEGAPKVKLSFLHAA